MRRVLGCTSTNYADWRVVGASSSSSVNVPEAYFEVTGRFAEMQYTNRKDRSTASWVRGETGGTYLTVKFVARGQGLCRVSFPHLYAGIRTAFCAICGLDTS